MVTLALVDHAIQLVEQSFAACQNDFKSADIDIDVTRNKPMHLALPVHAEHLSREDKNWLFVYYRSRAAGFPDIPLPNLSQAPAVSPEDFHARLVRRLSIMRQVRPHLFCHLCEHDAEVASIALQQGWDFKPPDRQRGE